MTEPASAARQALATRPMRALSAMLAVQLLVALANAAAPVLAPAVAPTLGFEPERIGLYAAVSYLCAALTGLYGGEGVARLGGMRLNQLALIGCALGAAVAAWGPPSALLLAAACVGAGYGLVNPAAAAVLAHHAPPRARGLYFSIKQTGVPIGVGLAGLLLPLGLAAWGWRASVGVLAAVCIAVIAVLVPQVARLEPPTPAAPAREGVRALLARVWRAPVLRAMCVASTAYAVSQQVFVTFLVSWLHLAQHWSLAAAAGVLAGSQLLSVAARIGLGALGDRTRDAGRVLAATGVAMALALLTMAAVAWAGGGAPAGWAVAAALACAATAMGWNGVFFGALAEHVPREDLARVSGATQFFTFAGGMLGPLVFGEALRGDVPWAVCYAAAALVPAAATVGLVRGLRLNAPRSPRA